MRKFITITIALVMAGLISTQTVSASTTSNYWLVASDGGIFSFGGAQFYGSTGAIQLNKPITGMAATYDGNGYWLVAQDGGVFTFGDAQYKGSPQDPNRDIAWLYKDTDVQKVVGITRSDGFDGYWVYDNLGNVWNFGNAPHLDVDYSAVLASNSPVVGFASMPYDNVNDWYGGWLAKADGAVYALGDADFKGSLGGVKLNKPIVGIAPTETGNGYWMVASDGGIFSFGDAKFYGSTGAMRLNKPIVGMIPSHDDNGYWLVASDGGIFSFGSAQFEGSTGAMRLNKPILGAASTFSY